MSFFKIFRVKDNSYVNFDRQRLASLFTPPPLRRPSFSLSALCTYDSRFLRPPALPAVVLSIFFHFVRTHRSRVFDSGCHHDVIRSSPSRHGPARIMPLFISVF